MVIFHGMNVRNATVKDVEAITFNSSVFVSDFDFRISDFFIPLCSLRQESQGLWLN